LTARRVPVRLFALLRERAGAERIEVDVPGHRPDVAALREALATARPEIASALPSCRVAVDERFLDEAAELPESGEIALVPPASGG
jgi:molybdopterin converting factor subunit 1